MSHTIQPKIVSREILKPSSPTPNHPEIHKLSFFDQFGPNSYEALVFFYTQETGQGLDSIAHRSSLLRTSLSRAISQYYPLAGRLRGDKVSVDCNDQGVVFLEARIELRLSELLDNPREEIIQHLFPDGLQFKDADLSTPLVVQVTFFECGGMAIAVCISHKLMDMASVCSFVFNWATMTRDSGKEISLDFNLGTLYPSPNVPSIGPSDVIFQETIAPATTRIVFSKSKIAKLKAQMAQGAESPTKVELVTAMICKTAMSAATTSSKIPKKFSLAQAMNLRKRLSPPLTEKNVGNFASVIFVASTEQSRKVDLKWLVRELRQRKIELLSYCNSASTCEELCLMIQAHMEKNTELNNQMNFNSYACTCWCRFPYYDSDFGWGKPAWVTTPGFISKNSIMMLDTRDGDGIEAIITLEEADMALFERDQELLAFATVNPPPLSIIL